MLWMDEALQHPHWQPSYKVRFHSSSRKSREFFFSDFWSRHVLVLTWFNAKLWAGCPWLFQRRRSKKILDLNWHREFIVALCFARLTRLIWHANELAFLLSNSWLAKSLRIYSFSSSAKMQILSCFHQFHYQRLFAPHLSWLSAIIFTPRSSTKFFTKRRAPHTALSLLISFYFQKTLIYREAKQATLDYNIKSLSVALSSRLTADYFPRVVIGAV